MKFIWSIAIASILCIINTSTTSAQTSDTTITVKVKGITCATDLKMIQTSIEKLEGVNECRVGKRGATTSFNITFNQGALTEKDLYTAIEGTASCENPNEKPYKVKP